MKNCLLRASLRCAPGDREGGLQSEGDGAIMIAGERIERVLDSLSLATAGAFKEAMASLASLEPDRFGFIEEALRVFLSELETTREEGDRALLELQEAKLDLEKKLETIERQQVAITELSTPIIDVWDDILTLPVVGPMDSVRATDMAEKLLRRVVDARARWVLVDLTGVSSMDLETADHLIRLARSVRMIGGRCIVTGISPDIARVLVELGVGLEDLTPLRSVREGLKHCMAERARLGRAQEPGQ
jgi:rsbT co-antagonist protein RsbR